MAYFIDSKYARGPARWERARKNAADCPDSFGAHLFNARLDAAAVVSQILGASYHRPYCFWTNSYSQREWKRQYYTCSLLCTALQACLDFSLRIVADPQDQTSIVAADLAAYVTGDSSTGSRKVTSDLPTKTVRCQVCAKSIEPSGTVQPLLGVVSPPPEPQPLPPVDEPTDLTHTFFVDVTTGKIYTPDSLRLLVVTDREAELLLGASEDTVAKFARRHGKEVD